MDIAGPDRQTRKDTDNGNVSHKDSERANRKDPSM